MDHQRPSSISPSRSSSAVRGRRSEPRLTGGISRMLCGCAPMAGGASTVTAWPSGRRTPSSSTTTPFCTRPRATMEDLPSNAKGNRKIRVGTVVKIELHAGSFEPEAAPLLIDLGINPLLVGVVIIQGFLHCFHWQVEVLRNIFRAAVPHDDVGDEMPDKHVPAFDAELLGEPLVQLGLQPLVSRCGIHPPLLLSRSTGTRVDRQASFERAKPGASGGRTV